MDDRDRDRDCNCEQAQDAQKKLLDCQVTLNSVATTCAGLSGLMGCLGHHALAVCLESAAAQARHTLAATLDDGVPKVLMMRKEG